ncbi:MAG TPA: hypothetical protein VGC54_08785 [Planctomycetota bacterium]
MAATRTSDKRLPARKDRAVAEDADWRSLLLFEQGKLPPETSLAALLDRTAPLPAGAGAQPFRIALESPV